MLLRLTTFYFRRSASPLIIADCFRNLRDAPCILVIGGLRERTALDLLRREAGRHGMIVEETGRLPVEKLSRELQAASCGVATTPYDALGKSGAAAAMLEHGLPVIAHDDGDTPQEALFAPGPFQERIVFLEDSDFSSHLRQLVEGPRPAFYDGVAHTAESFLHSLSSEA